MDIRIAIVEDDADIRESLGFIINGSDGFRCEYLYQDAESAVADLPDQLIDVVLVDIELPGISGIEAVRILNPKMNKTDFIMLTVKQDDSSVFNSLCAGATGYLMKDIPPDDLLNKITEVVNGGAPMSSNIARQVISSFNIPTIPSPLSKRETEILRLLCNGMNYRSIATELFLSSHTVKSHVKNIYRKLHVHSRAEAVSKAIKDNLL
ncbi:MAG: response regulator transcription factor [Bacteroidota bacterium]